MRVLLVEPEYYTRYPPLGLLKIAAYEKKQGNQIQLVRGNQRVATPGKIYITSLFTYSWRPVHTAVQYYKSQFPGVQISLGGIYASMLPEHAARSGADEVHTGLFQDAEYLMPAWDLVPEWDGSILFASRGCIRKCRFCSVPKLEGPPSAFKQSIRGFVWPGHTQVILFDNNILGSPNWTNVMDELADLGLMVDFNQGLDARLLTDRSAEYLSRLRLKLVRLAYDHRKAASYVKRAIERLGAVGIGGRKIMVYTLFNYRDNPEDFFERVRNISGWGAVSYPMRYEPPTSLKKNSHVSRGWDEEELELVARARRVLGFGGAFPPYAGLVRKLEKANTFREAFTLREPKHMGRGQLARDPPSLLWGWGGLS